MIKSIKILLATAAVAFSPFASAAKYTVPEDGWYQLQNPITLVDVCSSMQMTCNVPAGVYTLINHSIPFFHPYHRQTITIGGGSTPPPVHNPEPPVHNPEPPTHNSTQYKIETTVVNQECQSRFPGRPLPIDAVPCVASCPNHYAATGGNCVGTVEDSVFVTDSNGNTIGTRPVTFRVPMIETAVDGGYSCQIDTESSFTSAETNNQNNNQTSTIITATAICSTVVAQ